MSKFGGKIGCWGGMAYNDNYGQVGVQVWGGGLIIQTAAETALLTDWFDRSRGWCSSNPGN